MEKDKINIDQFFKASLQNFEGNADESMFDAIKDSLDANVVPNPKISVDDFFKGAMVTYEGQADDVMFDAIKSKLDTPKVSVDSYFKEALLDYNSYALAIPFSEIQNKLDGERVIDEHFKSALQNYEGKALDKEFAVIRERVVKLQEEKARKRYAWLLLLLLIPAWFGINRYFNSNQKSTDIITNEVAPLQSSENNNESQSKNQGSNLRNEGKVSNPTISNSDNYSVTNSHLDGKDGSKQASSKNTPQATNSGNTYYDTTSGEQNNNAAASANESKNTVEVEDKGNPAKAEVPSTDNEKENATMEVKSKVGVIPNAKNNTTATTVRKPKPKFLIEVYGAASKNGRYLQTDENAKSYLSTRNASDKIGTRYNFGIDLSRQSNRLRFGFGLHEDQFGQQGNYQITKNIFDSFPHYQNGVIVGYFHVNFRDSLFVYAYHNTFTTIEIPLHLSYRVASFSQFDFEVGASVALSYLAAAKGIVPNASANDIIQLKNNLSAFNRVGSNGTVNMKLNYNISSNWRVSTEMYLKSNMTSLYKKSTGINELPYAFGMRWGIGYKF